MDTVNTLAGSAAKAIWGTNESKEEPVSGKTGDVSQGEPYDAGNMGESNDSTGAGATNEGKPTSTNTNTGATASTTATASSGATASTAAANTADVDAAPEKAQDSSLPRGDHSKEQGDVRPPSDPQNEDAAASAVDFDGPGPRPIEQIAKEHGGDAGSSSSVGSEGPGGAGAGAGGGDEEEEDGPQKKSHGEGTGEKYVKSSGLRADGGDFDAANPGAGREADRLLGEKGVHREEPGHKAGSPDVGGSKADHGDHGDHGSHGSHGSHGNGTKEHRGLGEKLKSKLHKSHGSSS